MKLSKTGFAALAVAALALAPNLARATQLELIYSGTFNTLNSLNPVSQSTATPFSAATPFTINAWFDTSSPNLAPPFGGPFAGFRAYAPSEANITIGGQLYGIETITENPTAGISVAIFDKNSFTPGRYGIGILQEPPQDGAGLVADFGVASPGFTVANITPTTYSQYYGVGYGSGVCLQGGGENCTLHAVTPLVLHDGSNAFNLTLGSYSEDYPVATPPDFQGTLNTAQLVGTPEPGTCALAGLAFAALGVFARRRRSLTQPR